MESKESRKAIAVVNGWFTRNKRDRQTGRQRQTDRQTDRDRQRQSDRDRETETERREGGRDGGRERVLMSRDTLEKNLYSSKTNRASFP